MAIAVFVVCRDKKNASDVTSDAYGVARERLELSTS